MNAKKIMGAVLVALLAAALFVGAGAAVVANGDTVFVYQKLDSSIQGQTWTNGDVSLTLTEVNGEYYFVPTENFKPGVYKNGTGDTAWTLNIQYPTASIAAIGSESQQSYIIPNGGTFYDDGTIKISNSTGKNAPTPIGYYLVNPAGVPKVGIPNTTVEGDLKDAVGTYTIQAVFASGAFATGTPSDLLVSKEVFTIHVASADDVEISAGVDTVVNGKTIPVTITGKPGTNFTLDYSKFGYKTNGTTPFANNEFTIPNTGKAVVYVNATDVGTGKITVKKGTGASFGDQSVSITVIKGTITAKTDKESYYIGDDIKISGTANTAETLYVYIKGTNIPFQNISDITISVENGEFEKKITADELEVKKNAGVSGKKLDAGTYTLYVSNVDPSTIWGMTTTGAVTLDDLEDKGIYGTASLIMKQPFISVTDAPSVAVRGTDYTVTGTAEAATNGLAVYVFGTNYYAATNGVNGVVTFPSNKNVVSIDKNEFTVEFKINDDMAAGQYFMVIQHPMYDGMFNIVANDTGDIILNNTGISSKVLFNVWERQTANAAEALCQALDTQDIDDMYVKLSFVVAAPTSTINPIPAEITQGSKLTVSGTTNLGEGETVTVELLSTAFAAVPKETVGSASFIALVTKTDEDGNWEVTFDTTGLNVDEYTVSVAVASIDATTTKINIVEGAPTEQPTENPTEQPTQTEQPTEAPTTPGFGALAALAGLGAVAVLLLRRE